MAQFVVYTAIIDRYDDPPTFRKWDDDIRYFCFANEPVETSGSRWELVDVPRYFEDSKITTGYLKANSHALFGEDVISLWVDGNLRDIDITSVSLAAMVAHAPIATVPHRLRTKVEQEIDEVVLVGLESSSSAERLRQRIRLAGYADDQPLAATMLVARDHRVSALRRANAAWWDLISSGVRRDQLTFNFALWETGVRQGYIDVDWRGPNSLFSSTPHSNPAGRAPGLGGPSVAHYRGARLAMPHLPADYPLDVCYASETWTEGERAAARALNGAVRATMECGDEIEGRYCHFPGAKLSEFTPSDPRRSWKREYLRRAVHGCHRAIEIGFNAGHVAALMLSSQPSLRLTSVERFDRPYSAPCAEIIRRLYGDRFDFVAGRSDQALDSVDLSDVDFVHIGGGRDRRLVKVDIDWFCEKAPEGCRLMLDDAYEDNVSNSLDEKSRAGKLRRAFCGFPSSGENLLFSKCG